MLKFNFTKIKSVICSGAIAVSALAAPMAVVESAPALMNASAASNDNYAKLLQYSLYFYDANMCGSSVNSDSQMTWRSNCHTGDEADGGFHDAGDHAMFGLPQGYSASTIGWSYYEFKDAYDSLGQTAHFKTISDHFCSFFKASTKLSGDNVTSFCYQKGSGKEDHAYWGTPETQSNTRKQYWTSNGASDIAAEYAAALAVNYINFGNADDLKYAKALFKFSTQYNQCAIDGPVENGEEFYKSYDYYDDQAWAAGWLYKATNDNTYKSFLETFMNSTNKGASGNSGCQWGVYSPMSWNNVSLGAACLQAEIDGNWSKVTTYLDSKCTSPNQYYFEMQWGSARYNASMQFCSLVATKYNAKDYRAWSQGQMDYLLGNNPKNTCFVVGLQSNSAKNPHHRAASCYSSYDEMGKNDNISSKGHVLVGALVGGPTSASGDYNDSIQDYTANEVADDYNAGLVGAAAGLYHFYKTGSVDSSIEGVKSTSRPIETTASVVTTTTNTEKPIITTTTTNGGNVNPSEAGVYEIKPNQQVKYDQNSDDKMVGWLWSSFNIPSSEKVKKVEVTISSNNGNIGKWQGAFGSSTSVAPDYWTQGTDMEKSISGNSGTITWEVPASTAEIIQYNYGGELKFGTWWIDCKDFTINSVSADRKRYNVGRCGS